MNHCAAKESCFLSSVMPKMAFVCTLRWRSRERATLELVKKLNDRAGALLVHQFLLLALLLSLGGADAGPPAIYGRGERWVMMVQGAGRGGVGAHLALEY